MYLVISRVRQLEEKIKGCPLFSYQLFGYRFFLFYVIFTILFLYTQRIDSIPEPLMYILKSQQVTFVERLDLFLSIFG